MGAACLLIQERTVSKFPCPKCCPHNGEGDDGWGACDMYQMGAWSEIFVASHFMNLFSVGFSHSAISIWAFIGSGTGKFLKDGNFHRKCFRECLWAGFGHD
uniref:Uncharacterized protein n=1 Tax=Eutreptiella gymnastica TaxID=73025 RepID=A0A7S4LIL0_9EUGL